MIETDWISRIVFSVLSLALFINACKLTQNRTTETGKFVEAQPNFVIAKGHTSNALFHYISLRATSF